MQRNKRYRWTTGKDMVALFGYRTGLTGDRMAILAAVWQKELGHLSKYWCLNGFKNGTLYVNSRSSAATQELHFRGNGIVRALNKYFTRPWIKNIKVSTR